MEGVPYFIPVEEAQSIAFKTPPLTADEECDLDHAHGIRPLTIHPWTDSRAVLIQVQPIP